MNQYLRRDDLEIALGQSGAKVRRPDGAPIVLESGRGVTPASHEFIDEQVAKCDDKLCGGAYADALTSSSDFWIAS